METQNIKKKPNIFDIISNTNNNSLTAVDFIYQALSALNSYDDFEKFKSQIFEAVYDIRESLQYINDLVMKELTEKSMQQNFQEEAKNDNYYTDNNNINSNTLGLRYNYDAYLNQNNQKVNVTQDNAGQSQTQQLNFDYSKNSFYEQKPNNTFSNENPSLQLKDQYNISNDKSNMQYQFHNTINNTMNEEEPVNEQIPPQKYQKAQYVEENNYNNMVAQMPLPQQSPNLTNPYLPPKSTSDPLDNLAYESKGSEDSNVIDKATLKKQKISRVADIITKINSDQELYDIIIQLFGEGILDELMSSKVDDCLVNNVEKSINEIERLRRNDLENSSDEKVSPQPESIRPTFKNPPQNKVIPPQQPLYYQSPNTESTNQMNQTSQMNKSYAEELLASKGLMNKYPKTVQTILSKTGPLNISRYSEITKPKFSGEFNYERSLRFGNIRLNQSGKKNKSKTIIHQKAFVNYTSPHGHYFDSSLQNGGVSKLPTYLSKSKNKRAFSPVREYIKSSTIPYNRSLKIMSQ